MIGGLFFRFFDAIARFYRKMKFRYEVSCPHKDFKIIGPITVINRNIIIGRNVVIYPGAMFWGDGPIRIGNNVSIGNSTIIFASKGGGVVIGDDTQIAAQCYIIDMDHGYRANQLVCKQHNDVSPIEIGQDCWLGANVTVLKGSIIEDGAIIGAKGLVKGHIMANSISLGIPARHYKYRDDVIKE